MISVAIDGPAGAGKSTIAKTASARLGFIYVDTGALYRAIGFHVVSSGANVDDEKSVVECLPNIKIELKFIDGVQHVFVNDADVSDKIRTEEISSCASKVSAIPKVREFLLDMQRNFAKTNNIVMDGRDIGTVVLPDADVKIFLTASAKTRAQRRYKELIEKGQSVEFDDVLADIEKRDYADSHREIAPLKQADDAVLADTSDLTLEESIELIKNIIADRLKK